MNAVTLDPMRFSVNGQKVEIGDISVASNVLTEGQIRKLVNENYVYGILGTIVKQAGSVSGLKMRLLDSGAIVLRSDLFLLKDKFTVRYLAREVPISEIDISPSDPLDLLRRM